MTAPPLPRYADLHRRNENFQFNRLAPLPANSNGKLFQPPAASDTPTTLFEASFPLSPFGPLQRYIRKGDMKTGLIFTDGSCLDNGNPTARAGCSLVFRPALQPPQDANAELIAQCRMGECSFRLEAEGIDGVLYPQTNNRAELRAVIAALQFRAWGGEGFDHLVIATDSEYVVKGATDWVKKWQRNGWRTAQGTAVLNQDLWRCLLEELEKHGGRGLTVHFWRIPREHNTEADRFAKIAADEPECQKFGTINGVMC